MNQQSVETGRAIRLLHRADQDRGRKTNHRAKPCPGGPAHPLSSKPAGEQVAIHNGQVAAESPTKRTGKIAGYQQSMPLKPAASLKLRESTTCGIHTPPGSSKTEQSPSSQSPAGWAMLLCAPLSRYTGTSCHKHYKTAQTLPNAPSEASWPRPPKPRRCGLNAPYSCLPRSSSRYRLP